MYQSDSLYRLSETDNSKVEIVANGPLVAQVVFNFEGWHVGDKSYDVVECLTIEPGTHYYRSQIKLFNGNENDTLATGLPNLKEIPVESFKTDAGWYVIYSHGKQSENDDVLGMAVGIANDHFLDQSESYIQKVDSSSYAALLQPHNGFYSYYFFAGWEKETANFKDQDFFKQIIIKELQKKVNNTRVTFNE